jgi:PAS domain S-box-containing protein
MQVRFRAKDGQIVVALCHCDVIAVEGIPCLLNTFEDVSERLRINSALQAAEEARRSADALLATAFRAMPDPMAILDLESDAYIEVNPAFERVYGYERAEVIGKTPDEIAIFADEDARVRLKPELLRAGRLRDVEVRARCKDGSIIDLVASAEIVQMAGRPRVLRMTRDVTDKRRAEAERAVLEAQLRQAQKLEALGTLAGGIAHDFNNILMAVTGNLSLARASVTPGTLPASSLAEAEEACLRARQLTWRLLTFSKGGVPVKKIVSLGPLLNEAARLATRGTNVTCRLTIAPDLWSASADDGQLVQVFTNLILNAQQAMPAGGIVDVTAANTVESVEHWRYALRAEPGPYVRVSIADQGIGIPEENIGRIFDPYFTTKQVGSGLGLATSYTMVKNHGGYFSVQSKPGHGTTVTVNLPASDAASAVASEGAIRAPVRRDISSAESARSRILVMDDEPSIRTLAVNMLTFLGHDAEAASDGQLAIEQFRHAFQSGHPFDAVILDLIVPNGMGGREALEQLKAIDPAVSGIIVSGYAQDPVITDYREHGFKAVIAKPFTLQELRWTLDSVMPATARWTVH